MTTILPNLAMITKYFVATCVLLVIVFAPAYLARQTKKGKTEQGIIRLASWLLGWTGIGWLVALIISIKK